MLALRLPWKSITIYEIAKLIEGPFWADSDGYGLLLYVCFLRPGRHSWKNNMSKVEFWIVQWIITGKRLTILTSKWYHADDRKDSKTIKISCKGTSETQNIMTRER